VLGQGFGSARPATARNGRIRRVSSVRRPRRPGEETIDRSEETMRTMRWIRNLALAVGLMAGGFWAGLAFADQPAMKKALGHLEKAEKSLENATSDKGGHRAKALDHVRKAIDEVEAGIKFDRRH
jgi:hypothetical protein